jgi:hypothetical protein
MPRALVANTAVVPRDARDREMERLRRRRMFYRAAGCNHWVFEDAERSGAVIEFIEAGDGDRLRAALAAAPDEPAARPRIYQEMELD